MTAPIAIVGAAARLPGAPDLEAYWDLLVNGRDAVTEIPDQRWCKAAYGHPDPGHPGKSYTWAAGVLSDPGAFDAAFFGISPREADQVDPAQRLLLELVWEAMEDGGQRPSRWAGSGAGVFIGASGTEYANLALGDPAAGNAYFMTGTTTGIAANRISYVFDLHGPSFIVDTACSSSLVALHQACQAIRSGEVGAAVAGGVNMLMTPFPFAGFSAAGMLSPDGRCFAFDARANGYVRSEGGGVVLLKPLDAALADGDAIRAVVRGTGLNSDGRTMGLSLPSGEMQGRLLRHVYDRFEVDAGELGFVEAHGTGTAAGDPIELGALGRELGRRRDRPLRVGSAKTNVGHLEVASGMAGLLKTVLALEHRIAPPSVHYETPNPDIAFDELNLEVVVRPTPLGDGELTAGVNSFGFGGTNAHAVLGAAPAAAAEPAPVPAAAAGPLPPLLLSARSEASLKASAQVWAARLEAASPAEAARDIRGAARRRDHHRHRAHAWGATPADLAAVLRAPEVEHLRAGWSDGRAAAGRTAFVFTGNGAQFPGMARDALAHSPAFRAAVEEVDAELAPRLGWSVAERLAGDEAPETLARTDVAQPLLFAVQVAVVRALEAAGVRPAMVLGHSVGEIAAAWASGALSLADACRVVEARSRQQQRTAGAGRMAALALGREAALDAIAAVDPRLELAAENSPDATTVAGPADALARLKEAAAAEGWRCTPLALDYAFHSAAMDAIHDDLVADLDGLQAVAAAIPFVSTVEGGEIEGGRLGPDYWWRNIRERVRFAEAVDAAVAAGARVLVEVGPHAILQSYMRQGLKAAEAEGRVLATLAKRPAPRDPFPAITGRLYAAGADLSAGGAYDGPSTPRGLPAYPWSRQDHWLPWTAEQRELVLQKQDGRLIGVRDGADGAWSRMLDVRLEPWLADHALEGQPLLPAAAMAEIALAAARVRHPVGDVEVSDLEILRALPLEPGRPRELRVRLGEDRRVSLESRARLSDEGWSLHAVARVGEAAGAAAAPPPPATVTARLDGEAVYAAARRLGLDYGPAFQTVESVEITGADAARVHLRADRPTASGQVLSTELLDGAFQGFLALLLAGGGGAQGDSLLPARLGRVRLHAPFDRPPVLAHLAVRRRGVRSVMGEVLLLDARGAVVAEVREAWFRRVRLRSAPVADDRTFRFDLTPAPLSEGEPWVPAPAALLASPTVAPEAGGAAEHPETSALLEAYLVAAAHEAMSKVAGAAMFPAADLIARVHRDAAPLAFCALELLCRHGLATEAAGIWTLAPAHGFGDRADIWRTLSEEGPALTAELALAADTAATLPRLLHEGLDAARAPAALLEHMLSGSPTARRAQAALGDALMRLAEHRPEGRPLRVLELGAGAGGLTRTLLRRLASGGAAVRYLATDPDPEVAARLAASLQDAPGAAAQAWAPGAGAEAPQGRFDVVVSCGALTRRTRAALADVRRVLAPGGALLAAEPQPSALLDLVLGRTPAWWAASLTPELPVSPLRPGSAWESALADAGFEAVATSQPCGAPWSVTLLAASAPTAAEPAVPIAEAPLRLLGALDGPLARRLAEGQAQDAADAVWLAPDGGPAERGASLLDAARALAACASPPRLWVVVRGAETEPAEAALLGLARTLANEHPELHPRVVDLAPDLSPGDAAARLRAEVAARSDETEVAHTPAGRFAPRLRRGAPPVDPAPGAPRRLDAAQPGLLSSLAWSPAAAPAPGPGEVALRVEASGLNFRDVMWAQGLLPEEALLDGFAGPTLGLECAGVVTAVGEGVDAPALGDRVMAFAPAALASDVVTAAHAVVRLPDAMGFAEAATVPVAFLTVVYALGHVARLGAGERVLIHGAAGGVGLAAVQFAQARGAEVFATAGSDAKREVLRQLGCDHVLDSRSLAFAEDVRRLTGGAGVDVVLNSLAGEAMERSLGLLRPFGRFLELGKRDFFENTRVGLRPLRENVSYHAIDADRLPLARPDLAAELLRETLAMMQAGELRPLPYRAFARAEAEDAFRLMQGAGHIGKIVLTPDAATTGGAPPLAPARAFAVRDDAAYVVTGGLAGFGLETARWLAHRGARRLALLGRRGAATPGADEALAALAAAGVDARAYACDVADGEALAAVLDRVRGELGPLAGWVHAAMAVDDGLLRDMDAPRLAATFAAKLDGALNLDRLTAGDALDWALLFSSATTVLGAPGQGAYVAANLGLEALAARRAAQGRATMAVGWGPIADAGFLHREGAALDALERRLSAAPLPAAEALDALPGLWACGRPALTYAAVHWEAARKRLPILSRPLFSDVASGDVAEETDLAERLAGLSPADARGVVTELLLDEVARILSSGAEKVDAHRPLAELGMDSLMAVELRMTLESKLKVNLPLLSLSDTATVGSLAGRITASILEAQAAGSAGTSIDGAPPSTASPAVLAETARLHGAEALSTPSARLRPEATAAE